TAPDLAHVNLMHGTKWHGNHLGPFKTPAKEDDPRHMPPNFYYDQKDLVAARQQGKAWTWSTARPHASCGLSTGNPQFSRTSCRQKITPLFRRQAVNWEGKSVNFQSLSGFRCACTHLNLFN